MLKAMEDLGMRYPQPVSPQFQAPQGLTPEQEAIILGTMKREIGEQTGENLRAVRTSAAQRGVFRSGQLPALEGEVRKAGTNALQRALSSYLSQKSNMMYGANMAENQFNMNKWLPLFQAWQRNQAGLGNTFGKMVRL